MKRRPLPKKKVKYYPTILIFSAHPEDSVLGMGGTMAKLAREGYDVINVVFSCAQQNHWWLRQVYTPDRVMDECIKAAESLDCRKTIFLRLEDPFAQDFTVLQHQVEELIRKYNPVRVYTHLPEARESAHRRVAQLVEGVLGDLKYRGTVYRFGIWTLDLRQKALPQVIVDVSATFPRKRQAAKRFRSRALWMLQLWPMAVLRALRNGFRIRRRFAELFYVTPLEDIAR